MKQNRLKSLKICQGIRYKRLLEASGFSKRYGIFFSATYSHNFAHDFLLPFHSNYGPILHRFPHAARHWLKIAKFIYPTCLQRPVGGDRVGILQRCLVY